MKKYVGPDRNRPKACCKRVSIKNLSPLLDTSGLIKIKVGKIGKKVSETLTHG